MEPVLPEKTKWQKICHDDSCAPYYSYCSYCRRSKGCDSEDKRLVKEYAADQIHINEIIRENDDKAKCVSFTDWCEQYFTYDPVLKSWSSWGRTFKTDELYDMHQDFLYQNKLKQP